jgi:hypothetical protein
MKPAPPEYVPVNGKTYSLFGDSTSTSGYYNTIRKLADEATELEPDIQKLVGTINKFSSNKRALARSLKTGDHHNLGSLILGMIDPYLKVYTEKTEEHLKTLLVTKLWDRRLATTREQYHLYMLEIELTNRLRVSEFVKADRKIALTPYCLQDFSVNCKSEKSEFDYQCRHCSANCFQNYASEILKAHNIEPYIWMEGNMKHLGKLTLNEKKTFGVLGIACVPELTFGMRNCRKNNIPVVGIPLNANRCVRWFGEFFPNSIDLSELERLLTKKIFDY